MHDTAGDFCDIIELLSSKNLFLLFCNFQLYTIMKFNYLFLFSSLVALFISCQTATKEKYSGQTLHIINNSNQGLRDKGLSIKRDKLILQEREGFPSIRDQNGTLIPAQLDDIDGDGKWDELFLVTDLSVGENKILTLEWIDNPLEFTVRTNVRFGKRESADEPVQARSEDTLPADGLPRSVGYQPYQTDGPTWENDKVGFRHYFDGRNSKDVFGKKTPEMSPDDVGINAVGAVEDNYHVMEDWGRDVLAVGNSVGLGGIALLINDQPARIGVTVEDAVNNIESSIFQILSEGPVRSIISFQYVNWETNGRSYPRIEERVSIMPGMYAYKNEVSVQGLQGDEHLAIGLVNIHNDNPLKEITAFKDWVVLMTHDEQTYNKEWYLGMALIIPKSDYLEFIEAPKTGVLSNTYLAKMNIQNDKAISYYSVAAWELSDEGFKDRAYFEQYIRDLVAHIEADISIEIK